MPACSHFNGRSKLRARASPLFYPHTYTASTRASHVPGINLTRVLAGFAVPREAPRTTRVLAGSSKEKASIERVEEERHRTHIDSFYDLDCKENNRGSTLLYLTTHL